MSVIYAVDQLSPRQWSAVCKDFADYSIYQTWGFGEISAADTGSRLSRIVVREDDTVIGAAQVRIKKLPLVNSGLAYVYFGPIGGRSLSSIDNFTKVLCCLRREYAERRGLNVRIVPNLWGQSVEKCPCRAVGDSGFFAGTSVPAYRTFMVDLLPAEDELRMKLAQKWRNGLNQAEKREVRVEVRVDDKAMRQFEELYERMWNKKQFETGVTVSSFRRLQQLLPTEEKLTIHLAYFDGMLTAGHVSSTLGDTCLYLLGASNDMGRDCKASYSLQWHAMLAAKVAGARWYDLGGIDPKCNSGVYHFKSGLGGLDTTFVGPFEARAKGMGRYLVPMAERVYRSLSLLRNKQKQKNERATMRPAELKVRLDTPCPTAAKLSS